MTKAEPDVVGTVTIKVGDGYGNKETFRIPTQFDDNARRNHGGQTLQRLADRGGLGWSEGVDILEGKQWNTTPQIGAETKFRNALAALSTPKAQGEDAPASDAELVEAMAKELASAVDLWDWDLLPNQRDTLDHKDGCKDYWRAKAQSILPLLASREAEVLEALIRDADGHTRRLLVALGEYGAWCGFGDWMQEAQDWRERIPDHLKTNNVQALRTLSKGETP